MITIRHRIALLFALGSCLLCTTQAGAQTGEAGNTVDGLSFNLVKAQGGGTYTGDLSLSIPLLTVPGRNGLDYTIKLNYESGIRVEQEASWVGLGFNLQLGSVTRNVVDRVDEQNAYMFSNDGMRFNLDNCLPGEGISCPNQNYPEEGPGIMIEHKPDPFYETWDNYHLHLPSGSHELIATIDEDDGRVKFITKRFSPIRIVHEFAEAPHTDFITGFTVLDSDGTIYRFRHRANLRVKAGAQSVNFGAPEGVWFAATDMSFPIRWDLSEICEQAGVAGFDWDESENNYGNCIRIHYDDYAVGDQNNPEKALDYSHEQSLSIGSRFTVTSASSGTGRLNGRLYYDYSYPTEIRTPTHVAVFVTSPRTDYLESSTDVGYGTYSDAPKKLDVIMLYRLKPDGSRVPVRGVRLLYETDSAKQLKDGALTLVGLRELGASELLIPDNEEFDVALPQYQFGYDANPDYPGSALRDEFGYYFGNGAAWSLTDITYPTGATVAYEYENDAYEWFLWCGAGTECGTYAQKTHYFSDPTVAGGARLLTMTVDDGLSAPKVWTYHYGDGVKSAVNTGSLRAYRTNVSSGLAGHVGYRWVETELPDNGGCIRQYFTSGVAENPGLKPVTGLPPDEPVDDREIAADVIAQQTDPDGKTYKYWVDNSTLRGHIWKTEYLDEQRNVVRTAASDFDEVTTGQWIEEPFAPDLQGSLRFFTRSLRLDKSAERAWEGQETTGTLTQTTEYAYLNIGLPELISQITPAQGGEARARVTELEYAHQSEGSPYAIMWNAGMLTQIAKTFVSRGVRFSTHLDQGFRDGDAVTTWRMAKETNEQTNAPLRIVKHLERLGTGIDNDMSPNGVVNVLEYERYDDYGNVIQTKSAAGLQAAVRWDKLGAVPLVTVTNATYDEVTISNGDVDNFVVGTYPADAQATITHYDSRFLLPIRIQDANNTVSFEYDSFGRVTHKRDADGMLLEEYTYTYSRTSHDGGFDPANPNLIRICYFITPRTTSNGTCDREEKRFYDGLGRLVQTQTRADNSGQSYVITRVDYDGNGRTAREWDPVQRNSGGTFQSLDSFDESQRQFVEYAYENDARGRVATVFPQGISNENQAVRTTYGTEILQYVTRWNSGSELDWVFGNSTATYTETTNENGGQVRDYFDAFGNHILNRRYLSGVPTDTWFYYDSEGQILGVDDPETRKTRYRYDEMGRLLSRATPDADGDDDGISTDEENIYHSVDLYTDADFYFKSDATRNVRFSQDPKLAAVDSIAFVQYDVFGRKIRAGAAPFSWSFGELDNEGRFPGGVYPFEQDPANWTTVNAYDARTAMTGEPWSNSFFYTFIQGLQLTFTKGRLVGTAFRDRTDEPWQISVYSYDREGRVQDLYICLPQMSACKHVRYDYDLQGFVTKVTYQPAAEDAFYHWYEYDAVGRLEKVFTNSRDERETGIQEAYYEYKPSGQVSVLQLGIDEEGDPLQSIEYTYNPRGWLMGINDPANLADENSTRRDVFAMQIGYDQAPSDAGSISYEPQHNGNISWLSWRTDCKPVSTQVDPICTGETLSEPLAAYFFAYDDLNRLLQADYFYSAVDVETQWMPSTRFDVGLPTQIDYDKVGNIRALVRAGNTLGYGYETGNRLAWIKQSNLGNLEERFEYDSNGNSTRLRYSTERPASLNGPGFRYTYRNLPDRMQHDDLVYYYNYDASGNRISKTVLLEGLEPSSTYYVRGANGTVLGVYDDAGKIMHWNIIAGGSTIGRIVPPATPDIQ